MNKRKNKRKSKTEKTISDFRIKDWPNKNWPAGLKEIPQPPDNLRIRGNDFNPLQKSTSHKTLCVVGARKHSDYGERACQEIISGVAGYPITIVSGLAYGIDSIAHRSALDAGLNTIAFPGSGLNDSVIYPAAHHNLAEEILCAGGCLISEFPDDFSATPWAFPQRNRLMVGISDAVLIIEGEEKSGSMITARMATDYNIDLAAVPGSIFNKTSAGTNALIQDGACMINNPIDLLRFLGFEIDDSDPSQNSPQKTTQEKRRQQLSKLPSDQKMIYDQIPKSNTVDRLVDEFPELQIGEINRILSILEVRELIEFVDGKICQK